MLVCYIQEVPGSNLMEHRVSSLRFFMLFLSPSRRMLGTVYQIRPCHTVSLDLKGGDAINNPSRRFSIELYSIFHKHLK
jgi:hypothetical protein